MYKGKKEKLHAYKRESKNMIKKIKGTKEKNNDLQYVKVKSKACENPKMELWAMLIRQKILRES